MKALKITITILTALSLLICLLFLGSYYGVIKTFKTYVVLSGSMEPVIKTGSIAISVPQKTYTTNDIVTFYSNQDKKQTTTHRILAKLYPDGTSAYPVFLTAGDANKTIDNKKIKEEEIVGKIYYALPGAGYFMNFVKQPKGFILFVVIPITIILYEEIKSLIAELHKGIKKIKIKKIPDENPKPKANYSLALLSVPIIAVVFALTAISSSYFSDRETSIQNVFSAGIWTTPSPTATPTPTIIPVTPTPTSSPTPTPIDVSNCNKYCKTLYGTGGDCANTCTPPKHDEGIRLNCTQDSCCCN